MIPALNWSEIRKALSDSAKDKTAQVSVISSSNAGWDACSLLVWGVLYDEIVSSARVATQIIVLQIYFYIPVQ